MFIANIRLSHLTRKGDLVDPYNEPKRNLYQSRKIRTSGKSWCDHQDNQEDVNNPRVLINQEIIDNQRVPPKVPIILARPVLDVAFQITTSLTSSIMKPPSGGDFYKNGTCYKLSILMVNLMVSPMKILNSILRTS